LAANGRESKRAALLPYVLCPAFSRHIGCGLARRQRHEWAERSAEVARKIDAGCAASVGVADRRSAISRCSFSNSPAVWRCLHYLTAARRCLGVSVHTAANKPYKISRRLPSLYRYFGSYCRS